jgi:hypothetical protein
MEAALSTYGDELFGDESRLPPDLQRLVRYVRFMDAAFRIPIVGMNVGADAVIGVIPGVGDVVGAVFSLHVLFIARRYGVPPAVLLRMIFKTALDLGLGSVPFFGDIFDVRYRDKLANVRLLLEHRTL